VEGESGVGRGGGVVGGGNPGDAQAAHTWVGEALIGGSGDVILLAEVLSDAGAAAAQTG